MARLMMHKRILREFSKLPTKVQKRLSDLVEEFEKDPQAPSIGLHPLKESMLDPKVRGLKGLPGGYRGIVIAPEKGDTYLLVQVDAHDKAYEWARNKRFEVHPRTGVFQMFETEDIIDRVGSASSSQGGKDSRDSRTAHETDVTTAVPAAAYPLSRLGDEELLGAGVPAPLIPAIRTIDSDAALEALSEYLPPDCRDVLFGIAAGMSLDEVLAEMLGIDSEAPRAVPEGPGDFSGIADRPQFDLVEVRSPDELKEVLGRSLEEWRVFLHPYQRKVVYRKTKGPLNINGAAGTGKTVALMHRAVHLARNLESAVQRVLVTTFTTNLSVTIKSHIERLAPEVAPRIQVTNLHALSRSLCQRVGWTGRIADGQDLEDLWGAVFTDIDLDRLPFGREEIIAEFDEVVDSGGIDDEDGYLTALRTGRGRRISRDQRKALWPVFRDFRRLLKKRNLLTVEGAIHEARLAAEGGNIPRFRHVLVDEVQDFSLEALRLIRALSPIGEGLSDPLCTVGDGHQRIYRNKIPLSHAGIETRGRSHRLKVNYRTTEQIRKFAHQILAGLSIDDLNGEIVTTLGDHSILSGSEPTQVTCRNEAEEAKATVEWVRTLIKDKGLKDHEICVAPDLDHVKSALTHAGFPVFTLRDRTEDPGAGEPGIRTGSRPRIKGLEFRAVALCGADPKDAINDPENAPLLERCQRYVVATRAREYLLVTRAGVKENKNSAPKGTR